ncbi:MAG: thioredoxin [Chthoniobacteraceae bacterium]|nr:thioredoxin [Chthoniobacteraceae bacterium]
MKTLFTFAIALVGLAASSFAKEGWTEDFDKGLATAQAEKKIALVDFTGSDWCSWCIKLDKEIFSQPKFKEYAAKNLVLVEIDFPQIKALPKEQKAQNDKLAKKYSIEGYPTVVVLNSEGKQIAQLGYMTGGAEAFIAKLEALAKK